MIQELPSLVDRIVFSNKWGFRKLQYNYDSLLKENCKVKVFMKFEEDILKQNDDCFGELKLFADDETYYCGDFVFSPRGRHRPVVPMGGISFNKENITRKYHIIIKENFEINKAIYKEFSDFSMSDIFWSEVFSYKLLFNVSNVCLQSNLIDVEIISKKIHISTKALLVEDFSLKGGEKDFNQFHNDTKYFEPRDLMNLEIFEILIGNSDFYLDYNELGHFHIHNACTFNFGDIQIPIPYDFQYNVMATPKYRRHENFTIKKQAHINAERIKYMVSTVKEGVSLSFLENAIEYGIKQLPFYPFSPKLNDRYNVYYDSLKKELF